MHYDALGLSLQGTATGCPIPDKPYMREWSGHVRPKAAFTVTKQREAYFYLFIYFKGIRALKINDAKRCNTGLMMWWKTI